MKTKYIIIILIPAMLYFGSIGCVRRLPEVAVQDASKYKNYQSQNDIGIAVDVFFEKKRLKKFFGSDLLADYDILPVNIVVENNLRQPLLIATENILLLKTDTEMQKPSGNPARPLDAQMTKLQSAQDATNNAMLAINVISPAAGLILLPVGLILVDQAALIQSIRRNIDAKALYDKSIYNKGELHQGFVYLPFKDLEKLNIARLQINVKNIKTEAITTFAFDIDMSKIKEEVKVRKGEDKNEQQSEKK